MDRRERDTRSAAAVVDFTNAKDRARQEFKDDADINNVLKRFGVNAPQRQVQYKEIDYNLDLQTAIHARAEAEDAYKQLPENLRSRYKTVDQLLEAIRVGRLKMDMTQPDTTPAREILAQRTLERERRLEEDEKALEEINKRRKPSKKEDT